MVVNHTLNFSFMPKWSDARNEMNSLAVQYQDFQRQTNDYFRTSGRWQKSYSIVDTCTNLIPVMVVGCCGDG